MATALNDDIREVQRSGLAAHLRQMPQVLAQGARVLFDARAEALATSIEGVSSWRLDRTDATAFDEPGRIVLAHVMGTLALDIDLQRYPALRIVAVSSGAQALRQAIAAALLEPLVHAFNAMQIGAWRVADVRRVIGRHVDDATLRARVVLRFEEREHEVVAHANPAMLALFARRIEASRHMTTLAPLRVPGRIALGRRSIAISALERLRPGDVLLRAMPAATVAALREGGPFRVRVTWGTHGLTQMSALAETNGNSLAIIEEPNMTDQAQHFDGDDAPFAADMEGESGPIEIGELDLPVQFELDSVALPLAQLSALRPGYVIELDTPIADARIRLVAHGQTIGYGELIAVAEHLGIRITRMAHGDGPVR
jgi:type III secretion protein Q